MAHNPTPLIEAVLPNVQSGSSYRVFAGEAYGRVKEIVEKIIASALIYLPPSAKDFKNLDIDKYLARFVRGSYGIDYKQRIKIMKLLWDQSARSLAAATSYTSATMQGTTRIFVSSACGAHVVRAHLRT